mmetsp:Transcript_12323/g.18468  ORF Transcript_12323/g.18468 Transcript_12323/m.18468 type:complete len:82 (+) Transcript_12323:1168-1413(+)
MRMDLECFLEDPNNAKAQQTCLWSVPFAVDTAAVEFVTAPAFDAFVFETPPQLATQAPFSAAALHAAAADGASAAVKTLAA